MATLVARRSGPLCSTTLRSHTEAGVVAMIKVGLPAGLEVVALQGGALATKGFHALVERLDSLPRLHALDLDNNTITAKALEVLLASPQLGQIPIITMRSNRLGFPDKQRLLDNAAASVAFKSGV
jgi:hypothetical protein